jgi:hypothetical protein
MHPELEDFLMGTKAFLPEPPPKPKPAITDDFHYDEPLAYLVKNYSDYGREYEIFHDEAEARRHARKQTDESREEDALRDFEVYPLYAGNPCES